MKEKEFNKKLNQRMALLKIKIENIKPHIESSERLNGLYNKLLIEKAILKKNSDNCSCGGIGIIDRLTRLIRRKDKTLISDYFHS